MKRVNLLKKGYKSKSFGFHKLKFVCACLGTIFLLVSGAFNVKAQENSDKNPGNKSKMEYKTEEGVSFEVDGLAAVKNITRFDDRCEYGMEHPEEKDRIKDVSVEIFDIPQNAAKPSKHMKRIIIRGISKDAEITYIRMWPQWCAINHASLMIEPTPIKSASSESASSESASSQSASSQSASSQSASSQSTLSESASSQSASSQSASNESASSEPAENHVNSARYDKNCSFFKKHVDGAGEVFYSFDFNPELSDEINNVDPNKYAAVDEKRRSELIADEVTDQFGCLAPKFNLNKFLMTVFLKNSKGEPIEPIEFEVSNEGLKQPSILADLQKLNYSLVEKDGKCYVKIEGFPKQHVNKINEVYAEVKRGKKTEKVLEVLDLPVDEKGAVWALCEKDSKYMQSIKNKLILAVNFSDSEGFFYNLDMKRINA